MGRRPELRQEWREGQPEDDGVVGKLPVDGPEHCALDHTAGHHLYGNGDGQLYGGEKHHWGRSDRDPDHRRADIHRHPIEMIGYGPGHRPCPR